MVAHEQHPSRFAGGTAATGDCAQEGSVTVGCHIAGQRAGLSEPERFRLRELEARQRLPACVEQAGAERPALPGGVADRHRFAPVLADSPRLGRSLLRRGPDHRHAVRRHGRVALGDDFAFAGLAGCCRRGAPARQREEQRERREQRYGRPVQPAQKRLRRSQCSSPASISVEVRGNASDVDTLLPPGPASRVVVVFSGCSACV